MRKGASFLEQLSELVQEASPWEWYTSFKFRVMQLHLLIDWERLLDGAQDLFGWGEDLS